MEKIWSDEAWEDYIYWQAEDSMQAPESSSELPAAEEEASPE